MKMTHIILWVIMGLLAVLIVTHPSGFSGAVASVGGVGYKESQLLSGAGVTSGTTGTVSGPGFKTSF